MERRAFFRGLLIAGIIANIVVIILISVVESKPEEVTEYEKYVSETNYFSIDCPKDWTVSEFQSYGSFSHINITREYGTGITIDFSEISGLMNDIRKLNPYYSQKNHMTAVHKKAILNLEENRYEFECGETEEAMVFGSEGFITPFRFSTNTSLINRKMKGTVISTIFGGLNYRIIMTCREEEKEAMTIILGRLLDSFQPILYDAGQDIRGENIPSLEDLE